MPKIGGKYKARKRLYNSLITSAAVIAVILAVQSTALGVDYANIYTDYQKQFSHFAPAGKHTDTESYKYNPALGSTVQEQLQKNLERRHANCNDCHDPHSATRGSSPLGSYFGAGTQANVSGVKVTSWDQDFTVDADGDGDKFNDNKFAFVSAVVKEYELCFKCHTKYSFNFALYKATYGRDVAYNWTKNSYYQTGDAATDIVVTETDLATEFNPKNDSFHPVLAPGKTAGTQELKWAEDPNLPSIRVTFNQTFTPGINADSRIKCTDCHASDSSGVKGPHGSTQKYILRQRAPTEEPTITRSSYYLGSIEYGGGPSGASPFPYKTTYNMTWYVRTEDVLCYVCHDLKYYGPGRGHPSRAKHWNNCQWHRPIALDEVGCASCKVTPVHGASSNRYLMLLKEQGWTTPTNPSRYNPNVRNWCFNCHDFVPGQASGYVGGGYPSCPRFYSVDEDGLEKEETRIHFQSARVMAGENYDIPLPTPDMPNLKGLGNLAEYRYYNRDDDYILFKYGTPRVTEDNLYKVRFDQPSSGDRPDGEPIGEIGYEDRISLVTLDHAKDTRVYLSVDGDALATKTLKTAKTVTDNLGNDLTDVIGRRTADKDDRSGWYQGVVGYGNTISEIYEAGNSFVMDFGDLSREKTIKLVWSVNEEKGGKLPVLIQTKDEKGAWVTRGSARHAEDRYGYIDIKSFFPDGTKDFKVKIIPTLNSVDFMAVSVKDEPVKKTVLSLARADYRKFGSSAAEDVSGKLNARDGDTVAFDYMDNCDLYFPVPAKDKTLTKRDFVFAPVGWYETGGSIHPAAVLEPMTAEKAQDFARVTPAGGYANHYNVELIDPGEWNERYADRILTP